MVNRNLSKDDLRSEMRIGVFHFMYKWIEKKNIGNASFFFRLKDSVYFIDITKGKAVFEDIEITEEDELSEFREILRFGTGNYTILSELSTDDIYERTKNFYKEILTHCIDKSVNEQHEYLFRFNEPNLNRLIPTGVIGNSEKYLKNLPNNPIKEDFENLINQIISGDLEYAFHAKDEYGVKMHQYAIALKKKL